MNRYDVPLTCTSKWTSEGACATRDSSSSSLARMGLRGLICIPPLVSLCIALMAQPAVAATWPVPTSELSATLAFHQSYTAGTKSYVHSGIDISASAGLQIFSPMAGTVRFTGTVPSGDSRTGDTSSARTMNAVSVELHDGRIITLMPFASIAVVEGQPVAEGAVLGTLAAQGDASMSAPHLHLGYRQGATYLDPMQLFGAVPTATPGEAVAQTTPESSAFGLLPSGFASEAAGIVPSEEGAVAQGQPGAFESLPAPAEEGFGVIETGDYELARSGARPSSTWDSATDVLGQLGAACGEQLFSLVGAIRDLAQSAGITPIALLVGLCALASCMFLVFALVFARRFGPWVRDVAKSQTSRLSLFPGGGSMHKLFPASGAAFMSRSRIAQRR